MHTKTLQYGQSNNELLRFKTSELPIGLFGRFQIDKLCISTSNVTFTKAIWLEEHDGTVIVYINWKKYKMKQASDLFSLNVEYKNKAVDALKVGIRINFKKLKPEVQVSLSQPTVVWNKEMIVDVVIKPKHSISENWKYLNEKVDFCVSETSSFQSLNGQNKEIINALEEIKIPLSFVHSMPIESPIKKNRNEVVKLAVGNKHYAFNVTLVPNICQDYQLNVSRLTPYYNLGSNQLALWKIKADVDNPYSISSIKGARIDSDLLIIDNSGDDEWIISLKSKNALTELPSSAICASFSIQHSYATNEIVQFFLSPQYNTDVHYVRLMLEDCLRICNQDNANTPIVVYKTEAISYKRIGLKLNNISSEVTVKDIVANSCDAIAKEIRIEKKELCPGEGQSLFANINSSLPVGMWESTLFVGGSFTRPYSYVLKCEIREKQTCALDVEVLTNTLTTIFAGEEYANYKVCDIKLKARVNNIEEVEAYKPIVISDIKVTEGFSLKTNEVQIDPGKIIKCELILNGTIAQEYNLDCFRKQVMFEYGK